VFVRLERAHGTGGDAMTRDERTAEWLSHRPLYLVGARRWVFPVGLPQNPSLLRVEWRSGCGRIRCCDLVRLSQN
jgi:hypothetical protein